MVTQPDKPQGRKQILTPPPVKTLAQAHGISVYQPDSLKEGALMPLLHQTQPDLIVVVAYGKLCPIYIGISAYGLRECAWLSVAALRGAAPIQWSVIAGDQFAGVATMKMAEGLDTGDILLMERTELRARETAGELFDRLSHLGADVLRNTLPQLETGTLAGTPQDDAQATYASMLDKEMAVVDWSSPPMKSTV